VQVETFTGKSGKAAFFDAAQASKQHRGWALGHFITGSDGLPLTEDFEFKWHFCNAGDARTQWSNNVCGSAFTICLSGMYEFTLAPNGEDGPIVAEILTPGKAVFWENTMPHKWRCIESGYWVHVRRLPR
jgi:hypothetical protein